MKISKELRAPSEETYDDIFLTLRKQRPVPGTLFSDICNTLQSPKPLFQVWQHPVRLAALGFAVFVMGFVSSEQYSSWTMMANTNESLRDHYLQESPDYLVDIGSEI